MHNLTVNKAEKRLWVASVIGKSGLEYSFPYVFTLRGQLEEKKLLEAIDCVVSQYDAFFYRYQFTGEDVMKYLNTNRKLAGSLLTVENSDATQSVVHDFVSQPFDLEEGPLATYLLIKQTFNKYTLCLNFHHIATDGRSMEVLLAQISSYYNHNRLCFEVLPIKHGEVAVPPYQAADYWCRVFSDYEGEDLFSDYRAPSRASEGIGAKISRPMSIERLNAVKRFCSQYGLSPFHFFYFCFHVLVSRITGLCDVCCATAVSTRKDANDFDQVGMFINLVPSRVTLIDGQPIMTTLKSFKHQIVESMDYLDFSIDDLIAEINLTRTNTVIPFVQAVFAMENEVSLELQGVEVSSEVFDLGITRYDLAIDFVERWDSVVAPRFDAFFSTELFTVQQIEGFLKAFEAIIETCIQCHESDISSLTNIKVEL